MLRSFIPVWKKAPFLRLLSPVVAGIILQWYLQFDLSQILIAASCFVFAFALLHTLPLALRFRLQAVQGVLLNFILATAALFLTYHQDIRHDKKWFENFYHDTDYLVVTI